MLEIVKTADGSNTIYNNVVGENYHSKHGAVQESRHVFLNSGLKYVLTSEQLIAEPHPCEIALKSVAILEIGFGTGLNFLLSADFCTDQNIKLDYTGIEAYPLSTEMISSTSYQDYVSLELWESFQLNYRNAVLQPVQINPNCTLQIANCELLNFQPEKQFDLIYFDAFAAAHQPEMWTDDAIGHAINFLEPGGVFVTYAITGNLKRTIKALGCKVEKIPGAPGKREMLRAVKLL